MRTQRLLISAYQLIVLSQFAESDYNMEDAVDRFKKTLEWRRANSIDEIFQSTEDFSRFDNAYPHGIEGVSNKHEFCPDGILIQIL